MNDELLDRVDDAIENAMLSHESLNNDSVCSCGVVNNMDGDVLHGHRLGAVSAAVRGALASELTPAARADGASRMTNAQRDRLWQLCARYNVPFREDDYLLSSKQSGIGAGWVEGWVGGRDGSGITSRKTIYVGVSPEGESHS